MHRLHNRSGELWSPLVALATFFEEQGGVAGLREAISNAAAWDDQISEGKALSDREEAVLQALEMLTRGEHLSACGFRAAISVTRSGSCWGSRLTSLAARSGLVTC
jgi:hypothetical protein